MSYSITPRQLIALILMLLSSLGHADDGEVVVIPVTSQPAAALVDTVRPLVGEHGSVSAYYDRLIVKGSRDDIAAVRALLRQIDRPARRLIIEVRQRGGVALSTQQTAYGVRTDNVRLGRVPPGHQAQIGYQDFRTRAHDDSVRRVQALDGRPALIRTGRSVPVYEAYQDVYGRGFAQGFQVHYRDLSSGFYALPRLHGDQITVEIYQQHEAAAPGGQFTTQQAATVLRGGIGQWLTLGSLGGEDVNSRGEPGWQVQTQRSQDRQLELRVIPVD